MLKDRNDTNGNNGSLFPNGPLSVPGSINRSQWETDNQSESMKNLNPLLKWAGHPAHKMLSWANPVRLAKWFITPHASKKERHCPIIKPHRVAITDPCDKIQVIRSFGNISANRPLSPRHSGIHQR